MFKKGEGDFSPAVQRKGRKGSTLCFSVSMGTIYIIYVYYC